MAKKAALFPVRRFRMAGMGIINPNPVVSI
jgi:hypothetical protein